MKLTKREHKLLIPALENCIKDINILGSNIDYELECGLIMQALVSVA